MIFVKKENWGFTVRGSERSRRNYLALRSWFPEASTSDSMNSRDYLWFESEDQMSFAM